MVTKSASIGPERNEEDGHANGKRGREDPARQGILTEKIVHKGPLNLL
jgi:hypothetical protein